MNDAFTFKELSKIVINVFSTVICVDSLEAELSVLSLEHKTEVLDSFSGIRLFV